MSAVHDFFSSQLFWIYLKWLMILIIWAISAWGLYREDQQMKNLPEGMPSPLGIISLLRMLHQRNLQMWVLLSLVLTVSAINDIHYDRPQPSALTAAVTALPAVPPGSLAVANPAYDKVFDKPSSSASLPFSDITEFNEQDSKKQAYLDWLKRHYEAWLVTYYYLQKCGKADTQDLALIEGALQKELNAAQADNTVKSNILLAAAGSYHELYYDIPCDSGHLASTKSTYDANMQQIRNADSAPNQGLQPPVASQQIP